MTPEQRVAVFARASLGAGRPAVCPSGFDPEVWAGIVKDVAADLDVHVTFQVDGLKGLCARPASQMGVAR